MVCNQKGWDSSMPHCPESTPLLTYSGEGLAPASLTLCIWKSVLFRDHPVAPSSEVPSSWLRGPLIGRKQPCHFITLTSSHLRHVEEMIQQVGEHTVVREIRSQHLHWPLTNLLQFQLQEIQHLLLASTEPSHMST